MNVRRAVIDNGGVELAVFDFPSAEPAVVILHGLAGSSREFEQTARALAPRRVVLVDLRGHGDSTRAPADVSRDAFVNDVVKVIESLSDGPVSLVGQSMGGHTAMLVAARHPHLVDRLVLLEAGVGGDGDAQSRDSLRQYFESWPVPFADHASAGGFLGDSPLQRAWVDGLESRADGLWPRFEPGVMVAVMEHVDAHALWDDWERVALPTLLVFAEHGIFSPRMRAELTDRAGHASSIELADASHDAHLDAFAAWADALRTFVSTG
ncbi:alpha/beta hydrolase [Conyzicola nivalis]|uniref:AB hydrolase-1 domain-containing protein n=1 Tax=Conyzicola nivalis TaxID=1477021 RepID=A0A916WKX5_9MICO|nr:alpha/beta hydrolase [Conyzicola nivalis]GGB07365.1 hypothetical protein GCM10010979_22360 [Conyzicola nivalis]